MFDNYNLSLIDKIRNLEPKYKYAMLFYKMWVNDFILFKKY